MGSTAATFDFALKERYTNKQVVENLCFADRPLLGKMPRDTEFQGKGHPVPLIYRAPQGISVTLANAQTNAAINSGAAGPTKGFRFLVTAGDLAGSVEIGDKVIEMSRGNPGAFLQDKQVEIDGLYEQMSDQLAIALASDGGQSLGNSVGNVTTTTVTFANPADARNFEVDMNLEASLASGGAAADALLAGTAFVTAVDVDAGTITINALPGAWNAAGVLFLFRVGTFFGNTTNFILYGFRAYINSSPVSIYSSGARTADKQRMAGVVVPAADVAGLGIEQRIQILGSRLTGRGKGPGADSYVLHPEDWQTLAIALQSRGTRSLTDDSTSFGYEYLEVIAGGKRAKVYCDRFWPKALCGGLLMKTWTLFSMRELIHPLSGDGLQMLRKSTTNDYEYRLQAYPGLGCNAPGYNGRVPV